MFESLATLDAIVARESTANVSGYYSNNIRLYSLELINYLHHHLFIFDNVPTVCLEEVHEITRRKA